MFLQNLSLTVYGYFNDKRRYGCGFSSKLHDASVRLNMSPAQLKSYQREKLKHFLIHALKSPYWEARFQRYSVDPYSDEPEVELEKLPVLTKKEVKENIEGIRISTVSPQYAINTSGTTGAGLKFWETQESEAERWAVWWRYRSSYGVKRGVWCGLFGGRSFISLEETRQFYRINYASQQVLFSCYHLSPKNIGIYIRHLNDLQLKWLHGYPSFFSELSFLARKYNFRLNYVPDLITLGAENLSSYQALQIEAFFKVKPSQHYGLAESVANFSQMKGDDYLKVDEDFSYVEFLGEDRYGKEIIGTNFTNFAFPLIRYSTGDMASIKDDVVFPRQVLSIDGRSEDVVVLRTGERIGRLDHVFKKALFVDEAQIIQKNLDRIEVNIVKNERWDGFSEGFLEAEFQKRLGSDITIVFRLVENIERTSTGKLRFVVSEVS